MPTSVTAVEIAAGQLLPLLEGFDVREKLTTWAVFPAGAQRLPRVRAFVDFLVERFAAPGSGWAAERADRP
jgi:DNA-binding transcriptional LysR family regulator